MGLLDSVLGAVGGQDNHSLTDLVTGLITNPDSGGLTGLLEQFKSKGLGQLADSWVGTGENLPISAGQIQSALGSEQVQQMAARIGIEPEALSGQLASLLPQLIDKVTPNGNVPDQGSLQQSLGGMLRGLFGR